MPCILFLVPWYRDAIALSTVVIAIATVVNLVVSIFLWRATAGATKVARDIFEASHRPYLGIHEVHSIIEPDNHGLVFKCVVQNFGSVPAHNVEVLESTVIVSHKEPDFEPNRFGKYSVFPNSPMFQSIYCRRLRDAAHTLLHEPIELRAVLRYEGLAKQHYRYKYYAIYSVENQQFSPLNEESTEEGTAK